jgi:hypothetical protein
LAFSTSSRSRTPGRPLPLSPHPPQHTQLNLLLLQYPLLLTLSTEQLRATCDLLHTELGFASRRELGLFLRRHPELLLYGAQTLQVRPRRQRGPERERGAMAARCAAAEGRPLRPPPTASPTAPPPQDALDDLELFVGLTRREAASVLRANPRVLRASARVWRDNLQALEEELGLAPEQARSAVVAEPRILRLETAALLKHCARLARAAATSPAWAAQLRGLRGRGAAAALRLGAPAWARVEYLVATGQQAAMGLLSVLDAGAFAAAFPRAGEWLAARAARRQQGARGRAARRRRGAGAGAGAAAAAVGGADAAGGTAAAQQRQRQQVHRGQWRRPPGQQQEGEEGWAGTEQQQLSSGRRPPERRQRSSLDPYQAQQGEQRLLLRSGAEQQQQQQPQEQQAWPGPPPPPPPPRAPASALPPSLEELGIASVAPPPPSPPPAAEARPVAEPAPATAAACRGE